MKTTYRITVRQQRLEVSEQHVNEHDELHLDELHLDELLQAQPGVIDFSRLQVRLWTTAEEQTESTCSS